MTRPPENDLYAYDTEVLRKVMARRHVDAATLSTISHVSKGAILRMLNERVPASMKPDRVQVIEGKKGKTATLLAQHVPIQPHELCPDMRMLPPEEKYEPPRIEFNYYPPARKPVGDRRDRSDNRARRRLIRVMADE